MDRDELITVGEAARRLGVSKVTMARLVREGRFAVYADPLDRRKKLLDPKDVAAATRPRLANPKDDGTREETK